MAGRELSQRLTSLNLEAQRLGHSDGPDYVIIREPDGQKTIRVVTDADLIMINGRPVIAISTRQNSNPK